MRAMVRGMKGSLLTTPGKRKLLVGIAVLVLGGYVSVRIILQELGYQFYLREVAALGAPDFVGLRDSPVREAYQFVWLPSLGGNLLIRVVVRDDDHAALMLMVPDSNEPGRMRIDKILALNAEQIQELRRVVDAHRFWRERQRRKLAPDGVAWYLEVKRSGRHHFGCEISPHEGSLWIIGRHLTMLSGSELFILWVE